MVVAVTFSNPAITEVFIQVVVKGDGTSTLMLARIVDHAQEIKHCTFCFRCGGIGWGRPSLPWL